MKKIILNSSIKTIPKSTASLDNPNINTVSFILTDAEPNANGVGIRREDFISFAQSAVFMPIKMTEGSIEDHVGSRPVGAITQTEIDSDVIYGNGVVWPEERPADVALLKDKTASGEAQISWEIAYEEDIFDDSGIIWLKNPKLLAATLVKHPAYAGRTPMTGFASNLEISEESMTNEETEVTEEVEAIEEVTETETEVINTEEETESEEETEETEEIETEEVEVEAVETEETEEVEELAAIKAELEELRRFKMFTERSKIVTEMLGDLDTKDLTELVTMTDSQLKVVKRLVSSKKQTASIIDSNDTIVPHIPGIEAQNALSIFKKALENKTGGN